MAKTYRLTPFRRMFNKVAAPLIRAFGFGGRHTYLLTTYGRNSGSPLTHPVTLVENGERFLVAPYGVRAWVRNVRANGRVVLTRKRRTEELRAVELTPREGAPVLRQYAREVKVVRPYLDARPEDELEAWEGEAMTHPVFRVLEAS